MTEKDGKKTDALEVLPAASEPVAMEVSPEFGQTFDLVRTARAYPRNVRAAKEAAIALATLDQDTAEECFYCYERGGKNIIGPSIRAAEITVSSWGNVRYGSRVVGHDGKEVKAQGFCHDLERNVFCLIETTRRITGRDGKTFNDDMIAVTGNAAAAIARRNAVFGAVPRVLVSAVYDAAVAVVRGDAKPMKERWAMAVEAFGKFGIAEADLLQKLNHTDAQEVTSDDLVTLTGLRNAMRDGETTVEEAFGQKPISAPRKRGAKNQEKNKTDGGSNV